MNTIQSKCSILVLACAAALLLAACGDGAVKRMDPQERIRFELPAGWEAVPASMETRFKSAAAPGVNIQVNTVGKGSATLAAQRDAWLDFQRKSGGEVLYSEDWSTAHFDGVAYAYTGEGIMGGATWHYILLEGDAYVVTTYIQTPSGESEALLALFREIVASIEPAI